MLSTRSFPWRLALAPLLLAGCDRAPDLTGAAAAAADGSSPSVGTAQAPVVVVELFQSQGCSSCPPANANLNRLADRPGVLALSFAVTYWDQLGWKDTFASPAFTARQWDYARFAHRGGVSTPQVIVNGGAPIVGSNNEELARVIRERGPARGGPSVEIGGGGIRLSAAAVRAPATVWLVRYDPKVREVPIRAGENGGRTLPHRDIVRQLVRLGPYTGKSAGYPLPAAGEPGLRSAVLVQQGLGGPIIAARKL